ncbi:MAG: hypothetical protein ACI914_000248 [Candidatus Marivariicella framensis]|jgi:hypothetical protein|tara:strand:+ start:267 stop:575 length:309 start_codon:yes stop_codon:yes gene_type:complete
MNSIKIFFTSGLILILFQSCLIVNNFYETPSKTLTKEFGHKSNITKKLNPSGEFVDLKNRKSEIYFIDEIKPKGHLVIIDSLATDSLVKMIIIKDTIVKNYN